MSASTSWSGAKVMVRTPGKTLVSPAFKTARAAELEAERLRNTYYRGLDVTVTVEAAMTAEQWRDVGQALRAVLDAAEVSVARFAREAGHSTSTARRRLSGGRVFFPDLVAVARLTGQSVTALVEHLDDVLTPAVTR